MVNGTVGVGKPWFTWLHPLVPNPIYTWRRIVIFTVWFVTSKYRNKTEEFFFKNSLFYSFYPCTCIIYDTPGISGMYTSISSIYFDFHWKEWRNTTCLVALNEIWTFSNLIKKKYIYVQISILPSLITKSTQCIIYDRSVSRCNFWKETPKGRQIIQEA